MKYIANPVEVEAHVILAVDQAEKDGSMRLTLDSGAAVVADSGMTSRYIPKAGDYWVIQSDGYVYLNPKGVFERKYRPVKAAAGGN